MQRLFPVLLLALMMSTRPGLARYISLGATEEEPASAPDSGPDYIPPPIPQPENGGDEKQSPHTRPPPRFTLEKAPVYNASN